jgi:hypothetical protein
MTEHTPPRVEEDPEARVQAPDNGENEVYVASQWKLVWWRFR